MVLIEIEMLEIIETVQDLGNVFKLVLIENEVFDLDQLSEWSWQGTKFVLGQIEVVAVQLPYIFWEPFNAIPRQKDTFELRQTSNIAFVWFKLIEIQAYFLQTVKFRNPFGNMANMVALQIEIFQVFAATNAGWNTGQLAVRQVQAFDMIVFGKVNFTKTAIVESDCTQTFRRE